MSGGDDRERLLPGSGLSDDDARSDKLRAPMLSANSPEDCAKKNREDQQEIILYHRRWYVLVLYGYTGFMANLIWNTWGPISNSAEKAFGWADGDIALLADWGPIAYVFVSLPLAWLLANKGLRMAVLLMATTNVIGSALRCITMMNPAATWLINTAHLIINVGGPIAMAGPPLLSNTWFPVNQRTTATASANCIVNMGAATSFILGPFLVREYNGTSYNNTQDKTLAGILITNSSGNNSEHNNITEIRGDIALYMYISAGMSALAFILVLVYFPASPPTPPSQSAAVQRTNFRDGLKRIFSSGLFWVLCFPYVLGNGFYNMWGSVFDVIVKPLGVTQKNAGWIGFYGVLAGQVIQVFVGRFSDIFARKMKLYLIILYTLAFLSLLAFALMCAQVIPLDLWAIYLTTIIASMAQNGAVPLYYELVCEIVYPVSEGIANMVLTLMNNITGLIFTLVLVIPNIGTAWMNWALVGAIGLCLPVLCLFKERYSRLDIDTVTVTVNETVKNDEAEDHYKQNGSPTVQVL